VPAPNGREIIGLICVAWPASLQLRQGVGVSEVADLRTLQTVRDDLRYYDEVLSTSARLCALSGRPEFLQQYNDVIPPLEANLAQVLRIRPEQAEEFTNSTATANDELIALETEALRGCSEGDDKLTAEEAGPYVMGIGYELWKGTYIYGLQILRTDIDNVLINEREASWKSTVYLWYVGIIVLLLVGLTQAANQAQDEESERLAAEFDDLVERLQPSPVLPAAELVDAKQPLAPVVTAIPGAWGSRRSQNNRYTGKKGFWRRMAIALSPRDIFGTTPSVSKMGRSARLLRRWLPWVVLLVHAISLGCILSPPFLQIATEDLVRMGSLLGELNSLVGEIRYYDVILTGAARLCALTGDIRWMARYVQNVGYIDSAIGNVIIRQHSLQETYPGLKEKFGGNLGEVFVDTTDAANQRLIELEGVVIENCTHAALHHRDDLFSEEYMENKADLLLGLDTLASDLNIAIQYQEEENTQLATRTFYSVVVSLIVVRGVTGLCFAYYYVKLNYLDDKLKAVSVKGAIEERLNSSTTPWDTSHRAEDGP